MWALFSMETATNEIGRLFFWHRGGLLENSYRTQERAMAIGELKSYLQHNLPGTTGSIPPIMNGSAGICTDVYLGGLDMEKFPGCSRRHSLPHEYQAGGFRKEYICMEQDIHIEDMQESVVLYGPYAPKN